MGRKEKRRERKLTALAERFRSLVADVLSAIISGVVTAAILKWLGL